MLLKIGALMGSRTEHFSRMFLHFSWRIENNSFFPSHSFILFFLSGNERHGGHNGQPSKSFQVWNNFLKNKCWWVLTAYPRHLYSMRAFRWNLQIFQTIQFKRLSVRVGSTRYMLVCVYMSTFSHEFSSLSLSHHFHLVLTCFEVPLLLCGALNTGQVIE